MFTPASALFAFQCNISIQQVLLVVLLLLPAETNAKRGLQPVAVLYGTKAYDKVNRATLLEVLAKYIHEDDLNMVRATLGPMRLRTKNIATKKEAKITRGVAPGGPSSPIYLNAYEDELASEVEGIANRDGLREGEAVLVEDDVLL